MMKEQEDKTELLAAVSDIAVARSLAYLQVQYEACWAIRRTQFHPKFANQRWNRTLQREVENLQNAEDGPFFNLMVRIFQGFPSIFRGMDREFEKTLEEFISFLKSGSGPLSPREVEIVGDNCRKLLWLSQQLPAQWDEIARVKENRMIGQLPEWLRTFDALGKQMERDVQKQREDYSESVQSTLKSLEGAVSKIYREIRSYYSQQPRGSLAPAVCVLLSNWFPMTHLIGISPAANKSAPWAELKRHLTECAADIGARGAALSNDDMRSAAAAAFFVSAARVVVNEEGVKESIAFQTVWLAYGRMLENMVNTFRINPATKARSDLILDLEDAKNYWSEVNGYVKSFPNLQAIEKIVEVFELP